MHTTSYYFQRMPYARVAHFYTSSLVALRLNSTPGYRYLLLATLLPLHRVIFR